MFAGHHGLLDLTLALDCNNSQVDGQVSSVTTIEPLQGKWKAFGWTVLEVDGHDLGELVDALEARTDRPKVIVARTTPTAGLGVIEGLDDAHFMKVDGALRSALVDELARRL